ncbi:XF1762 family protein [Streptomyces syringium]|uniref:XF1762 family protein n=1 Tax=Streptomyces syringium TaxID=76729 RepID=UPI0033DD033B
MDTYDEGVRLHLVPLRQKQAKEVVAEWHRHHRPPPGAVFSVGAADQHGVLRAVAIVGRPVTRHLDDGETLEVTRSATDGARNANSLLHGACWRAAQALGYSRLITYTQEGESGASLRGAGWRIIAKRPPRGSGGTRCPLGRQPTAMRSSARPRRSPGRPARSPG